MKSGSEWTHHETLAASDGERYYGFGHALAVHGDTLVVGSWRHEPNHHDFSRNYGAAYVFTRSGDSWSEEQMLVASDRAICDYFGASVGVEDGLIVVGSPYDDNSRGANAGSAYIFAKANGGEWQESGKLLPPDLHAGACLGFSIASDSDHVLVGAPDQDAGSGVGSVYLSSASNMVSSAGLVVGTPIDGRKGWVASPAEHSVVQSETVQVGTGALRMTNSFDVVKGHQLIGGSGTEIVWIDFLAKMDPASLSLLVEYPDLNQYPDWQATAFAVDDEAHLIAYDGNAQNWCVASNLTVTTDFHRYSVRQDYANKTWDLYFDGTEVLQDLGFRDDGISEFSRFSFKGQWHSFSYLDELTIGTNQPSF